MSRTGYPLISREGWPAIFGVAALAVAVHHFAGLAWAVPLWLGVPALLFVFRDPERPIPALPLAVLSPVDGRVAAVGKGVDPYLGRDAVSIGIEMNRLGVYSTRSPVEGKVVQRWYTARAEAGVGSGRPRYGVQVRTDEGDDVVLAMVGGSRLRRPRCYVQHGERIGHGQRCGHILFGSRVEVYLPVNSRVDVRAGDRVMAGVSVLATLIHK